MDTATSSTDNEFLYARISGRIEKQIKDGLLKTGDKLPSVRALSREQNISISTAFKAYVELENMGMIEARPKSGYYVRFSPLQLTRLPDGKPPIKNLEQTDVSEMISMVYANMTEEGVLRLSQSAPHVSLIPVSKLSRSMMEAMRKTPSAGTNYENKQGNISLRKQIAKNAFNWGGHITENDVVTTHGCMEALVFCLRAISRPGDTIAIESPTYFGIFNVMLSLGLNVLEIPVDPHEGVDIQYLAQAIDEANIKACLFIPNFSNPAGSCMPDNRKQQLVTLLTSKQIPLIEDDIYGEIYFGKSRPRTCKSFDTAGWVMLCSSVSKSIAPGYRVGWCIPGRFRDQIINIKMMHTVTSATPTQAAIALFFETGRCDLHMRKLRKALHTQCLRYTQAITTHFPVDTKISRPQGGYTLWIELHKKINALELYQAAIAQNISIAPGQIFTTDARFTNFIRISFGIPFDDLVEQSFRILGELIRKML
ncbi:DNA-binding transcriptional regulator, MocR family, contains an aminotransferase domain [Mucilaginibacter sp. OK268]|uniref:aminotransferase-like domain-containing protein n=1 Tax=Mucilaginibacter sp. OK268 TaxID=1881048 RepID=UPI00088465FA|nr:PLP-dependent aminotransferase family protein [Mucilaginibacter sp. OK268]SDP53543.1 DNA-binding transcriptional regulator, MocR family, contains an aminotransferase domain [Mucilaginibacter sp. OK268]